MSVRIRLRRIGKNPKRRCFFRIAVFDRRSSRDSRSIEELGYYDPTKKPELIKINTERLEYWLSCGAQMSQTVKGLVNRAGKQSQAASETETEALAETKAAGEIKTEANAETKTETEVQAKPENSPEINKDN